MGLSPAAAFLLPPSQPPDIQFYFAKTDCCMGTVKVTLVNSKFAWQKFIFYYFFPEKKKVTVDLTL